MTAKVEVAFRGGERVRAKARCREGGHVEPGDRGPSLSRVTGGTKGLRHGSRLWYKATKKVPKWFKVPEATSSP